jgi:hypothetical protein
MSAHCHTMPIDITKIESQAIEISNITKGLMKIISHWPKVELKAVDAFLTIKKYFDQTDLSCFKDGSEKCSECLIIIEKHNIEILNKIEDLYKKSSKIKFIFITKYLCRYAIPILEDRIDTLHFANSSEFVTGMNNYICHLRTAPPTPTANWREKLKSLSN